MSNSNHPKAHDDAQLKAKQWEAVQSAAAQQEDETSDTSAAFPDTKSTLAERVVTVEIPPHTEFVRVARLAATGVASRMRFTYDQIEDIKLAISEACNNAILHAQPAPGIQNAALSSIIVRFWPHHDRLEISVADGGHLPPPGLPLHVSNSDETEENAADDLPESGMGLMLIQALMDEVSQPEAASGQTLSTTLHMTKRLRPL